MMTDSKRAERTTAELRSAWDDMLIASLEPRRATPIDDPELMPAAARRTATWPRATATSWATCTAPSSAPSTRTRGFPHFRNALSAS